MKTNVKSRTNAPKATLKTNEGAPAFKDSKEHELRRAVLSCFLWENQFYENGVDIEKRILDLASKVEPEKVAALAVEARHVFYLRHAPLLLLCALAKTGSGIPYLVQDTVARVVSRADEGGELLNLYWKLNGGNEKPIPNQFKKGLRRAFAKFDQYQLTKYDRGSAAVGLRDVAFLTHPKNISREQGHLWANFLNKDHYPEITKGRAKITEWFGRWEKLVPPDTWEVQLSAGKDKKETFTRLLKEKKLGYLALLRNLRNMVDAGVHHLLISEAILARKGADMVYPFRYVAAARYCPSMEVDLNDALLASINDLPQLPGVTGVLVDISGSMDHQLSGKSDLKRMDAAAALASILPTQYARVFSFSNDVKEVTRRRGIPGIELIIKSQSHGGTMLGFAVSEMNKYNFDRLIVITDEQSADPVPKPTAKFAYMINVASYRPSVARDQDWIRIEGFSENVIRYITEIEKWLD